MAQYQTGRVQVTSGTKNVVGTNTAWVANAAHGNLFSIAGEGVWFEIDVVVDDTHLTLKTNYTGESQTSAAYAVQRDFSPISSFPLPAFGDANVSALMKETLLKLDAALASISPVGQVMNGDIQASGIFDIEVLGGLIANGHDLTPAVPNGLATLDGSSKVPSAQLSAAVILALLNTVVGTLPTTSPGTGNGLWRDAAAGNVIKVA